VGEIFEFS